MVQRLRLADGARGGEGVQTEIMTVAEVAEYLRVDPDSVYRLIHEGQIRPLRVGRVMRVTRAEVGRWIEEQLTGAAVLAR